jgi:hypothetical protein
VRLGTLCRFEWEFLRESTMQYNFFASSAPSLLCTLFAVGSSVKLIRLLANELITLLWCSLTL